MEPLSQKRVLSSAENTPKMKLGDNTHGKRDVLKDLCLNTLQVTPRGKATPHKSGSGPSAKQTHLPQKSEHESYEDLAREFVEELVENIPANSGKNVQTSKYCGLEDTASITSVLSSEKSCDTLPDLLQPESVYKKQTDTDTETSHTTEYESAVETDAHDTSSLNESLSVDEVFDSSENVNQKSKCQEGDQIVPLSDAQVFSKENDLSAIVIVGDSPSSLSCSQLANNTSGESVLMPYEVEGKSDITFYDCIEVGESADITVLPQGDITILCADLASLDLNSSNGSVTAPLQNCVDVQNNSTSQQINNSLAVLSDSDLLSAGIGQSQNNSVVDNSVVNSNFETVHLVETEEHELSVLILDKTVDLSTIPELKNTLGNTGTSADSIDSNVDILTLHNDTFQCIDKESALHVLPENQDKDTVEQDPNYCEPAKRLTSQTSETALLQEGSEAFYLGAKEEAPVLEPTFEVLPCHQENIISDGNITFCDQELNLHLDTCEPEQKSDLNCTWEKKAATNATLVQSNKSVTEVDSSAIKDSNLNFEEFKNIHAEVIDSDFQYEKELIDKFHLIIKDDIETVVAETVSSSSKQIIKLETENITLTDHTERDFLITEFSCLEENKEIPTETLNSTSESPKESLVEEVSFIVGPVTEYPFEESLRSNESKSGDEITSDEKTNSEVEVAYNENIKSVTDIVVVEAHVDKVTCTNLYQNLQQIELLKEEEKTQNFASSNVKSETDKGDDISLEKLVNELVNQATVEHSICYSGKKEKSSLPFSSAEDLKIPKVFEVTEKVDTSSFSTVAFTEEKQAFEQTLEKCTNVRDIPPLTPVVLSVENQSQVKTSEVIQEKEKAASATPLTTGSFTEDSKFAKAESLFETLVNVNAVLLNSPVSVSLGEEKESSYKTPEPLQKSSGFTPLVTPLASNSPKETLFQKTHEIIEANTKVSPILPLVSELSAFDTVELFEQTEVSEETSITQVVIPSGSVLDFEDLAAEAANVSNDFLTASQEVGEPDITGEFETVVHPAKSVAMSDTGSTQKSESIPLDVKWLADSQSRTPSKRNSNVARVDPADGSTGLKSDTSSVIDCTNVEDPFKRRSLLQNSPPRDVVLPNIDNKCATPNHPTITLEKGAGETADIKENHSEAGPDTADSFSISGEELFKDPSAFEFLSSKASTHPVRDYRKESLYVKFDPLVGSNPVARSDKNIPLPPTMQEIKREDYLDLNTEASESPRHVTPVKNPALDLIDRLISLSPSPKKPETPKPPPVVVKQEPVNTSHSSKEYEVLIEELYVLRELLDQQDKVHQAEVTKYKTELETLKNKLNMIQQRNQEAEEREQQLNKKIIDKAQGQKQMSMIMEEYEKTISRLIAEKEAEHQANELEQESLMKEKDLALGHLTNMEIAFSDVHMKYERSKNVIEGFKKNEEVLRSSLAEFETTIHKQEQKYEMLKSHAMQQLETANQELDVLKRSHNAESAKLRAMLKKSELKSSSLEEVLEQKSKENQELVAICDDLISKVGN